MKVAVVSHDKIDGLLGKRGLPPLTVGDRAYVKIIGVENGKYLILLNGHQLEAEAKTPLRQGEVLAVRIEALEPKVILVPIEDQDATEGLIAAVKGFLRMFRKEPNLFSDIISQGNKMLTAEKIQAYEKFVTKGLLLDLVVKWDALLTNRGDLKEMASLLGFFHERDLAAGKKEADSIKSLLLQIAKELEHSGMVRPREVEEFARWVAATLNKIESCQVADALSRIRDGLFFLPVPFTFRGEPRVGEFYARVKEKDGQVECRAWIFVDLPKLGTLMVEMHLTGERLSISIRCERVESKEFLQGKISELRENLTKMGYQVGTMGLLVEKGIQETRQNLWQAMPAYQEGTFQVRV